MSDARDPIVRAAVVELAESAPLPPAWSTVSAQAMGPSRPRARPWVGASAALATFLLVLLAGAGGWWLATSQLSGSDGASQVVDSPASEVAFSAADGVTLRGQLWTGDSTGVVVAPAFGTGAEELSDVAATLAGAGHRVLLYELRGQGASEGVQSAEVLTSDLISAVEFLRTEGATDVFVLGFRHSATAAVRLAAADVPGLAGVAAMFAFPAYQGVDALEAAAAPRVPLHLVAAAQPDDTGPWAVELWRAGGSTGTIEIFSPVPPDADFMAHNGPKMVTEMLELIERTLG